jgi:predicted metal-dependent hydrolase
MTSMACPSHDEHQGLIYNVPLDAPPHASPMKFQPQVDVVRNARRRRTYKWSLADGRVRLELPTGLRAAEEARIVAEVGQRAERRLARATRPSDQKLLSRGRDLAHRHMPQAASRLRSVAWSDHQARRWGSCSAESGAIRLSSRLHGMPDYVLEAVLVHELAHLLESNHSPRFHALADSYPFAERARGFLEAVDRGQLGAADTWPNSDPLCGPHCT